MGCKRKRDGERDGEKGIVSPIGSMVGVIDTERERARGREGVEEVHIYDRSISVEYGEIR